MFTNVLTEIPSVWSVCVPIGRTDSDYVVLHTLSEPAASTTATVVTTAIDCEIMMLMSYCKQKSKILVGYLCDGQFETLLMSCVYFLTCVWLGPCTERIAVTMLLQ